MLYKHPQLKQIYKRNWLVKKDWLASHGTFKRAARYSAVVVAVAGLGALNVAILHTAKALGGYQASHVIGEPDFNSGYFNYGDPTTQNSLINPNDTVLDKAHNRLFVADSFSNRVMVFDVSGGVSDGMNASHVLGQANFTDNSCNTNSTSMCNPHYLAYDSANNRLFVSDSDNFRVLVFDLSGGISDGMAASHELGQIDFNSQVSDLTQTSFARPMGLAYASSSQSLYVADKDNNRVMVFDVSGSISDGMPASHVLGQTDFTSNTASSPAKAALSGPVALSYDSNHNYLYVSQANSHPAVFVFDVSGGASDFMQNSWQFGSADNDSEVMGDRTLDQPIGLSYDATDNVLFVADGTGDNELVYIYNMSGGVWDNIPAVDVLGNRDKGFGTGWYNGISQNSFTTPAGMTYDSVAQRLYIADSDDGRVVTYDNIVFPSAPPKDNTGYAASTALMQADLNSNVRGDVEPSAIAYDSAHQRLFIGNKVYNTNANGIPLSEQPNFTLDQNTHALVSLSFDSTSNRLFAAASDGTYVYDFTGGISNNMTPSSIINQGDGNARAVTYDSNHQRLYVGETFTSYISVYDLSGGIINGMSPSWTLGDGSCDVTAVAICRPAIYYDTSADRLFVSTSGLYRILVFDMSGSLSDGMAATWVLGQPNLTTNNGPGCCSPAPNDSNFYSPTGIAYDSANKHLFAGDATTGRVMVFDLTSGITNGMSAVNLLGKPDFTSTDAFDYTYDDSHTLTYPQQVLYSAATHRLYVGDSNESGSSYYGNNVDVFDLSSGVSDFMQNEIRIGDVSATLSSSEGPRGTALDSVHHRLFVVDGGSMIKVFDLDSNNQPIDPTTADHFLGRPYYQDSFSEVLGPNDATHISGITYDSVHNRLFVTDEGNLAAGCSGSRVMIYDLSAGLNDGMAASFVIGQPDFSSANCTTTQSGLVQAYGASMYDPATNYLYVPDDNRVLVFDLNGLSNGMNASFVIGQSDFVSSNNALAQDSFSARVGGLALDSSRHLLFAGDEDEGAAVGRILVFDTSALSNGMNASFVIGETDFTSSESAVKIDNLHGSDAAPDDKSFVPAGLAYDPVSELLFVADEYWSREMIFDVSNISNGQSAIGVIGQPNFDLTSGFSSPSAVSFLDTTGGGNGIGTNDSFDPVNRQLYLSDSNGHRVVLYKFIRLTTASLTGGTQNSSYSQTLSHSNSQGTVTYSVSSGSLPAGLVLGANTGQLSGTPTGSGTFNFTIKASDNNGSAGTFSDSKNFNLVVATAPSSPGGGSSGGGTNTTPPASPPKKTSKTPTSPIVITPTTGSTSTQTPTQAEPQSQPAPINSPNAYGGLAQPKVLATKHVWPTILKFVFPWLLFVLLGLAAARLAYQAWRERNLRLKLIKQIQAEKALSDERANFISLSSHYIRTPITAITGGIELLTSLSKDSIPAEQVNDLKNLSQQLSSSANDLLARAQFVPNQPEPSNNGVGRPFNNILVSPAAGFAQASFLVIMTATIAGSVAVISIADGILKYANIYDTSLVNFLTQIAALIALSVFFWGALRSHNKNKELRQQAEMQLREQRALDSSRNELIKGSLVAMQMPLGELKSKLEPLSAANPKITHPALDGISRLSGLLGKFTIVSSLQAGSMGTVQQTINVEQLFGQTSQRYDNALKSKNLSLTSDLEATQFAQDPLLASFMLDSLLSNAIKYSPEGQQIKVTSHLKSGQVVISVEDHGPGIPETKQAELMQPFSRAEDAATDFNQEGAGLSLYIDKLITKYLGGGIDIHSNSHGTTSSFSLPM